MSQRNLFNASSGKYEFYHPGKSQFSGHRTLSYLRLCLLGRWEGPPHSILSARESYRWFPKAPIQIQVFCSSIHSLICLFSKYLPTMDFTSLAEGSLVIKAGTSPPPGVYGTPQGSWSMLWICDSGDPFASCLCYYNPCPHSRLQTGTAL